MAIDEHGLTIPGSCLPLQAMAQANRGMMNPRPEPQQDDGIRNFAMDRADVEYLLAVLQEHAGRNSERLRERLERFLGEVPRVYDIKDQGQR